MRRKKRQTPISISTASTSKASILKANTKAAASNAKAAALSAKANAKAAALSAKASAKAAASIAKAAAASAKASAKAAASIAKATAASAKASAKAAVSSAKAAALNPNAAVWSAPTSSIETPQPADHYENVEMTTTVKMGLRAALNLSPMQYSRLQGVVEPLVRTISRMFRSASLAILYHLTDLAARGQDIPNLYRQKDTYWKEWMRFRADTGVVPVPRDNQAAATVDDEDDGNDDDDDDIEEGAPHEEVAATPPRGPGLLLHEVPVRVYLRVADDEKTVKVVFAMPDDVRRQSFAFGGERVGPELAGVFDQALGYAARSLKTAVVNNAYVTLIPTLKRLAKATLKATDWKSKTEGGANVTTNHIMSKVRGMANPEYELGSMWHPEVVAFVSEVRTRLGLTGDSFLFDDYLKPSKTRTFQQAFLFNRWMLQRFKALKQRGIKLSPVFSVSRAHVRLDRKILTVIALRVFAGSPPDSKMGKIVSEYRAMAKRLLEDLCDPKKLLPTRTKNPTPKPAVKGPALEDWSKSDEVLKAVWESDVAERMAQPDYVKMVADYAKYLSCQTLLVTSIFTAGGARKGWKFDGTMMTDGVSASINYSKMVRKKVIPAATKKMSKPESDTPTPDENYDKNMSSLVCDKRGYKFLFAGDDPGTRDIASITYCLNEADRKAYPQAMHVGRKNPKKTRELRWSLSGAEYRTKSGIKEEDAKKKRRFQCLEKRWQEMGRKSSLKTLDLVDIESYLRQYLEIEDLWWTLSLKRCESRANMHRYIGKRSVLDAFFAKVDSELHVLFPDATIMLAYGSAGLKMGKTGKNQVAVPTTGAYTAASRIFRDRCIVQDEWGTTKYDFSTGEVKNAVYRIPGGRHGHTAEKNMPCVKPEDKEKVDAIWKATLTRNKKGRGGRIDETSPTEEGGDTKKKYKTRYPEIRGLRYLPSTRTYFGRDPSAAGCIARLAAYRFKYGAKKKPAPFCRRSKAAEEEEEKEEDEEEAEAPTAMTTGSMI